MTHADDLAAAERACADACTALAETHAAAVDQRATQGQIGMPGTNRLAECWLTCAEMGRRLILLRTVTCRTCAGVGQVVELAGECSYASLGPCPDCTLGRARVIDLGRVVRHDP